MDCFGAVMSAVNAPPCERRRDPRFALAGSVRLVVGEPLVAVEGAILDVSAGGVRLALREGVAPLPGGEVEVQVTIREIRDPARPPTMRLKGLGQVVRREPASGALPCEVAVRLAAPLGFREYFSQLRVF
jgi:hypothetical protein